jgi:hypothetical protein
MSLLEAALCLFAALVATAVGSYLMLPSGPRELMEFDLPHRAARKSGTAEKHTVATGTPWATKTALDILDRGEMSTIGSLSGLMSMST